MTSGSSLGRYKPLTPVLLLDRAGCSGVQNSLYQPGCSTQGRWQGAAKDELGTGLRTRFSRAPSRPERGNLNVEDQEYDAGTRKSGIGACEFCFAPSATAVRQSGYYRLHGY